MKGFDWFQPTELRFGEGRLAEVGEVVSRFGRRCLLVSRPQRGPFGPAVARALELLDAAGLDVAHFDGVEPNPTTEVVSAGARLAVQHGSQVVVGLGGGSAMDVAKAIAVEATHPGSCWDYLFYRDTQPDERTLPIVAVPSTSGSASQVTQVAVVTDLAGRDKSALFHNRLFPRVGIVDPEIVRTLPPEATAATGFDVFCHAFESTLHPAASPYTRVLAEDAIRRVLNYLPRAVADGDDLEARREMAWADTLAGLCIANAGVTLPHGIGMAIGGMYPHVAHGKALAVCYPACTRFTVASAPDAFARLGAMLGVDDGSPEATGHRACDALDDLLREVGLWTDLAALGVPADELPALAEQSMVLPDYESNPRVATREEMLELLESSYRR